MAFHDSYASIDTLFLDAGGVIVQPSWARVSAALAAHGVDVAADVLRAADPLARRDIDNATAVSATTDHSRGWAYFNRVLGYAGVPLSEATDAALDELHAYHRAENLWEELLPGAVDALARLRARAPRMVVVSNANGRLRHLFDRLDLARWFDCLLDSHEWRVEKPDPALFHHALTAAGASAEHTMHVGDLYHVDIVGARAAGLRHAVLVDAGDLYPDADCPRVRGIGELEGLLLSAET